MQHVAYRRNGLTLQLYGNENQTYCLYFINDNNLFANVLNYYIIKVFLNKKVN